MESLANLLGMVPDILFFTFFIIKAKELKEKKIILGIGLGITYIVVVLLLKYNIFVYIIFLIVSFALLKYLYKEKTQIIDIFLLLISEIYLLVISLIFINFVKPDLSNYHLIFFINRACLIIPFLRKDGIQKFYASYCKLWNRSTNTSKRFKSLTLRNISLVCLDIFIFIANLTCMYIMNY